jgi:two-component sensor histidine kinase
VKSSQAAPIGLVVNELVTNAFKYAFSEGRAVEIDVRSKDAQVIIAVWDDGVGCPAEAKDGLGTRLITLLIGQMKGTITRVQLAKGCEVQVAFALDR